MAIFSTRAVFARASSEESPATASASKKIAMFIDDCSSGVVVHELKSATYSASVRDQSGLSTITWPGQGGKPNSPARAVKLRAEAVQRRLVHGLGQDQAIVLIGADGLLAAALAAHHDQAGACRAFRLGDSRSNNLANRRRLRSDTISATTSNFTPWRRSGRTWSAICSAAAPISSCSVDGAIDAADDQLRISGEETQQIDVFDDADEMLALFHHDAALVVFRHQQQRLRDEFVRFDGDEVELRDRSSPARRWSCPSAPPPWTGSCR